MSAEPTTIISAAVATRKSAPEERRPLRGIIARMLTR